MLFQTRFQEIKHQGESFFNITERHVDIRELRHHQRVLFPPNRFFHIMLCIYNQQAFSSQKGA